MSSDSKTQKSNKTSSNDSLAAKFNWYPGHIAKAERQLKEKIKLIDIIIELRDARVPLSSEHKDLAEWVNHKPIITAMNKSDLADTTKLNAFIEASEKNILIINSKQGDIKNLIKEIERISKPLHDKNKEKGLRNRPVRVMIVGYPNVGKSSLINKLSKTKKAKVENRPGVTRQQQWIAINLQTHLLDTPGIIPSKLYSEDQALKLALTNCLSEKAFDHFLIANDAIELLEKLYPGALKEHYKVKDDVISLESIAQSRGWLMTGGELDIERTASKVLHDLREGEIGKFCLD